MLHHVPLNSAYWIMLFKSLEDGEFLVRHVFFCLCYVYAQLIHELRASKV